jgi:adenosylcobinamide-GDP ribazoletransferase
MVCSLVLSAVVGFVLVGVWFIVPLAGMVVAMAVMTSHSNKTLECVTGDVMGATNELVRMVALVLLVAVLV